MQHPLLAPVYQRVWRPAWWLGAMAFDVPHLLQEKRKAVAALRLAPGEFVLDVACGPGNFTPAYAAAVAPTGRAIGIDLSRPMLRQAARDHAAPGTAYVEGSALRLPFGDGAFDGVACYGALYLIPDPFAALEEIVRVLRPGGRVAIMTTTAPDLVRAVAGRVGRASGMRFFSPAEVTGRLEAAGFTEVSREIHGFFQYVAATAPAGGSA
jgi:SAM-dependent methyltransferase